MELALARELLDLPADVPLLLFGAMGGGRDPRKGFDLLTAALVHLGGEFPELELVVFGQLTPRNPLFVSPFTTPATCTTISVCARSPAPPKRWWCRRGKRHSAKPPPKPRPVARPWSPLISAACQT